MAVSSGYHRIGRLMILLLLLTTAGCQLCAPRATVSVRAPAGPAQPLPDIFTATHAVVFEFKPHWWWPTLRLAALGYASVDCVTHSYRVVCLSPLGVKLFEVSKTNGATQVNTLLPTAGKQQPLVQAMGGDVASLFFDLVPPAGTLGEAREETWFFSCPAEQCRTEYTLAATTGLPVKKEIYEGRKRVKTVTFEDFASVEGRAVPSHISLQDRRNDYRLIFVLKEFHGAPRQVAP